MYGEYPAVLVADTHSAGRVRHGLCGPQRQPRLPRRHAACARGTKWPPATPTATASPTCRAGCSTSSPTARTPIPASDWLYGLLPPGNGDLVALIGSMDYGEDHGTFCASSVVAQGASDGANRAATRPTSRPASGGMVQGMAPDAKMVAIGNIYRSNQSIYNAYDPATCGLDGRPNTGDEPQIASHELRLLGRLEQWLGLPVALPDVPEPVQPQPGHGWPPPATAAPATAPSPRPPPRPP